MSDSLARLTAAIDRFADERDWQQFHSPKNLAMALMVEAAELAEHFQWLSQRQSSELPPEKKEEVAMEMADVLIYLCRLASRLDIDLLEASSAKMRLNDQRYPAAQCRGRTDKYPRWQR